MADTHWGRNETVVWPPHQPLYSYFALAGSVLLLCLFAWQHTRYSLTPMQRLYLTMYAKTDALGAFGAHSKHRLLWADGPQIHPTLATDPAVQPGATEIEPGTFVPLELSPAAHAAGLSRLYLLPAARYADAPLHAWLQDAIYAGQGLTGLYIAPAVESFAFLILALCFAVPADARRFRQMKYGRLLKGPVMLSPKEFNERMNAQ